MPFKYSFQLVSNFRYGHFKYTQGILMKMSEEST